MRSYPYCIVISYSGLFMKIGARFFITTGTVSVGSGSGSGSGTMTIGSGRTLSQMSASVVGPKRLNELPRFALTYR